MLSRTPFVLAAGVLLAVAGCDHRQVLRPQVDLQRGTQPAAAGAGAAKAGSWTGGAGHAEGAVGPGALYVMDVPERWNGNLVVYAHGYDEDGGPVELPDIAYLREPLLARGYAVAASSFSRGGYALKEGAQQTHQLRGLFASRFAPPRITYLAGQSLGGIIALKLAETYPDIYSGALLGCGVVGGTREEIQYVGNVRVLFDYFYPGVLPGSLLEVSSDANFETQVAPRVLQAMFQKPKGAFLMACMLRIPFAGPPELFEAIVRVLGFQFVGANDFLGRTHGHGFFDNREVVYQAPCLPQEVVDDLNAKVERYQAAPDAENYMTQYYEPSGRLEIPVVALHTTRDPIVPRFHEDRYRALVEAAGRGHFLRQRYVSKFGHCTYTAGELVAAFDELARWVEAPTP